MKKRIKRLLDRVFGNRPERTATRDGLQMPQS
jgi:hypothetical protein